MIRHVAPGGRNCVCPARRPEAFLRGVGSSKHPCLSFCVVRFGPWILGPLHIGRQVETLGASCAGKQKEALVGRGSIRASRTRDRVEIASLELLKFTRKF